MSQKFLFQAITVSSITIIVLTLFVSIRTLKMEKNVSAARSAGVHANPAANVTAGVESIITYSPVAETPAYLSDELTPYERYVEGLKLMKNDNLEDAIEAFSAVIKEAPKFSKAFINRARAYNNIEDYDSAIADCREALELDTGNGIAFNVLAIAQEGKGEIENAVESYKKSIEMTPGYVWAYNNLGLLYLRRRDFSEAYRHLRKAVDLDSREAIFRNNLGQVYENLGHFARARKIYEEAVELAGGYRKAENSLGRIKDNADKNPDNIVLEYEANDSTALSLNESLNQETNIENN